MENLATFKVYIMYMEKPVRVALAAKARLLISALGSAILFTAQVARNRILIF
jgi:hypothetical protein